ncbi:MAG: RNA ligase partner protein [Candidatus Anstonellales archaeon]
MKKRNFIIDTSIFINPNARKGFANSAHSAMLKFIKIAEKSKHEFYAPPSLFKELGNFIPECMDRFSMVVKKKAPNKYALYLPASVFESFLEDVRYRIGKGLKLAEKYALKPSASAAEIKRLREQYREIMRSGIVDSQEDFEIVLLAKEIDATIATADEGIAKMAEKLGCEFVDGKTFWKIITK